MPNIPFDPTSDASKKAWNSLVSILQRLSAFLRDDMVFVGRNIRNDISKFNSDISFMLENNTEKKNAIDVGTMLVIHHEAVKRAKG